MEDLDEEVRTTVNDLKNAMVKLANLAFTESFDKGERKYGDRWKQTGWTGIKGLADSKWDMFLNLLDTGADGEIEHHASDMMAWIVILAVRAMKGLTADDKRETVVINVDSLRIDYGKGFVLDDVMDELRDGKRVVIE